MAQSVCDRAFGYRGHDIVVRAATAATLAWLEEFLAPWFVASSTPGTADAPAPAAVVEVRADATLYQSRLCAAELSGRDAACFTMDRGEQRLALARAAAREFAVDTAAGMILGVRVAETGVRTIDVLAENERPGARLALMRILRELASAGASSRGELPLHGAAVAEGERVTLFVGTKRAGKSTLLVHALLHAGTRYVANDRVFARIEADTAVVHGMPTIVGLRCGTLGLATRLSDEIGSGAWHYASTVAEASVHRAAGTIAAGAGLHSPPGLSPAQLCALLETAPAAGGTLARLVFVEVDTDAASKFSLRNISAEEACARLLASGLVASGRAAPYLSGAPELDSVALAAQARRLVKRVPSFRCVLGRDAYVPPSIWDAIGDLGPGATQARAHG